MKQNIDIKNPKKKSPTNETTRRILNFLLYQGVFAWRNNTVGVPLRRGGEIIGFRSAGKKGVSDILGVYSCMGRGLFLAIEVKTGKDRLSPEQEGFLATVNKLGGVGLVVKNYEDFLEQWNQIENKASQLENKSSR